jgi:hypothetical protein
MAVEVVGSGWQQLVEELDAELRALHPDAVLVGPVIDHHGLPRLRVQIPRHARKAAKQLTREYEHRAASTCELCGETGRVHGGVVVVVRCETCSHVGGEG